MPSMPRPLAIAALAIALPFSAVRAQDDTPLGMQMETLSDAYRTLSKELKTPDAAKIPDYLASLQTIQETAIKAKPLVPAKAATLPDPEKGALTVGYRKDMIVFIEATLKAERALLDGDLTAAAAAIDSLKDLKSEGHEKYKN